MASVQPPGRKPGRHVRQYRETSRERFLTPEEYQRLGAALKRLEASGSMMIERANVKPISRWPIV